MNPRRILMLALAATALLIPAGLRHHLVWGGEYHQVLHVLQWLCVLLFGLGTCWAMQLARRRIDSGEIDLRWIWKGAILLGLVCLIAPPFLSEDVFSYIGRGRLMALHGANPYVDLASSYADKDPELISFMKGWASFPLPYGPLMAWITAGVAWLAEQFSFLDFAGRMWLAVYLFKILNIAVFLWGGVFLSRLAALRGDRFQGNALLLYLWNPFFLLEICVNAHNDVFLTTPLLWGLWEASRANHGRAALGILLSSLCKFTSLALGPLFLVLAWRERSLRPFVGAMIIGALTYSACYSMFWSGPGGLDWLARQGNLAGASLQHLGQAILGSSEDIWKLVGLGMFFVWLAFALRRIRDSRTLIIESALLLALLVLVALPIATAWYPSWWLPLALLAGRWTPALSLAWVIAPSYSIYLLTRTLDAPHQWLTWALTLALPTIILLATRTQRGNENTLTP